MSPMSPTDEQVERQVARRVEDVVRELQDPARQSMDLCREAAGLLAITETGYQRICEANDRLQEQVAALTAALARPAEGGGCRNYAGEAPGLSTLAADPADGFKALIDGESDPVVRQDCPSAGVRARASESRRGEPAPASTSRPAQAEDGWKTIETAEKGGASILLCVGRWITVGHWHRATKQWASNGPVYSPYPADEQPTHWRPLPEPPRDAEFNPIKFAGEESR